MINAEPTPRANTNDFSQSGEVDSRFSGPTQNNPLPPRKKTFSPKLVIGAVLLFLLVLGSGVGLYLTQRSQDLRQQAAGPQYPSPSPDLANCAYPNCDAECGSTSCGVSCASGAPCTTGRNTFFCRGWSQSGCNELHGSYIPELSNNSGSIGTITREKWCTTVQLDSWARNNTNQSIEESDAVVVYIGNNGQVCSEADKCDPATIPGFWDCTPSTPTPTPSVTPTPSPGPVSCDNLTGTIKRAQAINLDEQLTYTVTSSGGNAVTKVELVYHGNFEGPGWGTGWTGPIDLTPTDGTFSGTKSFNQMVAELVATGHNREQLLSQGIQYYANVYGPQGFCTGNGTWSIGGRPCTLNPICHGTIRPIPTTPTPTPSTSPSPTPIGPMCVNISMTKLTQPTNTPPGIGDSVQFTCGSDDGVTSYEFRVRQPNGTITMLSANGRISAPYIVETAGTFYAQCRICVDGTCQPWEPLPGSPTFEPASVPSTTTSDDQTTRR